VEDHVQQLERDLRSVKRYAVGMTIVVGAVAVMALVQARRTHFTEIDVERLNIVEQNGTRRMAIANSSRMAPVTFYGKEYPDVRGGDAIGGAGMVYFNDEGTEDGGYVWSGRRLPDGTYRAAGFLTFDQYNQDEALTLGYSDRNGRQEVGLTVIDEPKTSLQATIESVAVIRRLVDSAERQRRMERYVNAMRQSGETRANRLFAGKDASKTALVWLADPKGRPRLRLSVDSLGTAKVELLDEAGKVTDEWPNGK
jgi:hypothetical protein